MITYNKNIKPMKKIILSTLIALSIFGACTSKTAVENNGFLCLDAVNFYKQTKSEIRSWHLIQDEKGSYIEILPDTRITHSDPIINYSDAEPGATEINFSSEPGNMAIVHYKIKINNPGRYYVWLSTYSTGSEDNGVHVGYDGIWPKSGKQMQWCDGKNEWTWASRQRTDAVHCGESGLIYLDFEKAGNYDLQFSMREDGFSMKQIILSKEYDIRKLNCVSENISYSEPVSEKATN